eukprot:jgi/Bigna1/138530/aug1.45_g13238
MSGARRTSGVCSTAGGEHTLLKDARGQVFSAGACGLGWCRNMPMAASLFGWRKALLPEPAKKVIGGYYHNLAIGLLTGSVYSWGCGTFVEGRAEGSKPALGQGIDVKDLGEQPRLVKSISGSDLPVHDAAAGAYHSAVLTRTGKVLTFGAGQLGQLGRKTRGQTDSSGLPVDCEPAPVEGLPPGVPVRSIGAGFYNTLVTLQDGTVFCSGENQNSQCGARSNGRSNLFKMAQVVAKGLENEHIISAVGGYCHTLLLTRQGRVFTLGCSDDGQRGFDSSKVASTLTNELKLNGGCNDRIPLKAEKIAAGANHSVVLAENGDVYAFGSNEYGQCGTDQNVRINEDGEKERGPILSPVKIAVPSHASRIVSVSAGYAHTILTDDKDKVFVFGQNANGQLGIGKSSYSDEPLDVVVPTPIEFSE